MLFAWRICGGRGGLVRGHLLFGVLTLVVNYEFVLILMSTGILLYMPLSPEDSITYIMVYLVPPSLALLQSAISIASWIYASKCVEKAKRYAYIALTIANIPAVLIYYTAVLFYYIVFSNSIEPLAVF
ncbi:hypothetical protein [Pyrobaculum islandicum]|uniref:hypothetical protein n=1 Tax=Pyrobaculum islandicum TaxID=2277 RepID=UPI001FD7E548|nr:hypothetical protein [Pyrobaculum islandicum]